jgi:hypothetical protein
MYEQRIGKEVKQLQRALVRIYGHGFAAESRFCGTLAGRDFVTCQLPDRSWGGKAAWSWAYAHSLSRSPIRVDQRNRRSDHWFGGLRFRRKLCSKKGRSLDSLLRGAPSSSNHPATTVCRRRVASGRPG